MIGSFLTFGPLKLRDKVSIIRAFYSILRSAGNPPELRESGGISMLDWLRRRKQTPLAISRFWRVVLVSALSEELESIDARYGVDVFWKAVLSNRKGYRMGIPITPLGQLYDRCQTALRGRGGEILFRAAVRKLVTKDGELVGVRLDGQREEHADAYVLAVPHDVCWDLLPEDEKNRDPALQNIVKLRNAPITGVHFWFDRLVMKEAFIGLLDSTAQWIFNKTQLYDGVNSSPGQYLQLVISASYDLLEKPREEIIDLCLKELRQALPACRNANLVKATVIKEAAATFSPYPGVDRWRPKQYTSIPRLYLAGDWTDTGWPATMEGAVRSGYLAAEAVLRNGGTVKRFLQPDLPVDGLVRLLMRQ
jgi:zeta-carotene desaturase